MDRKLNGWKNFFSILKDLVVRGFVRPAPTIYFLSVIVLAGGVGFWYPILGETGEPNLNSAMTYVFALLAAVVADFFTSSRGEDFLDEWEEFEKDFTVLIVGLVVIIASLAVVGVALKSGFLAWLSMVGAAVFLWLLWWILLEPKKFGIPISRKIVEESTIGDPKQTKTADDKRKSLKELKEIKRKTGGES
jgi:hypothetical protein